MKTDKIKKYLIPNIPYLFIRIVATDAEKERWESLGYKVVGDNPAQNVDEKAEEEDGKISDPLKYLPAEELKQYAADNNINIGNATSQNGILKKIREIQPFIVDEA